jgi:hypothetical protein
MNCEDVLPLLNLLNDSALDSRNTADILEHLKECGQCQSEWDSMLAVRRQIRRMKNEIQVPPGLMDRVSAVIDRENTRRSIGAVASMNYRQLVAIAAGLVVLALGALYLLHQGQTVKPVTIEVASLVNREFAGDPAFELVADHQLLSEKLGYTIKYLKFPDWKINEVGTYRAKNIKGNDQIIARLQLHRVSDGREARIYCYQAPAGSLKTTSLADRDVGGKRVWLGRQGALSYACWTQNERDYLLISSLSQKELEELIRSA